ncbi:MAG: penicillin-binding protein activator [Methylococcaceae bacterium]
MNRHYVILPLFCILLLASCAIKSTQQQHFFDEAVQAESLIQNGQHKQAANLYQTLAQSKPAHRDLFSLLSAEAFIQSGDSVAAKTQADSINPQSLSPEQRNKLNLLHAQIHLSNGDAEQSLNKLSITQVYKLNPADQITFYQSLAFAHSLTGNILQSVEARIQLSSLLDSDHDIKENQRVIINSLDLLSTQTLTLKQPAAPDILGGWMSLTRLLKIARRNQNSTEFQTSLNEWKHLFPRHPANDGFLQSASEGAKHNFRLPSSIALLLPETGRFSQAAGVIKKGFLTAYHHSQTNFQPSLRFYDSSTANAVSLYHQAVSEGAELVIGPLSKQNIQDLALGTKLTTPVLALNHIPNLATDNLFQFGLSPIDGAKQISTKASREGYKNTIILTPESKQGQRINVHLSEHWQDMGGSVLESQSYNAKENDFSKPIKNLLNLDESKHRYNKLNRLLAQNIEYTERRRQDIDAIFLSASAKTARSIYPQLRFYRATRVPVYAMPQIYTGQPNPALDIDLNNITFCDIPWLFAEAYQGELSQESLRNKWQSIPRKYLRLMALGIDSFNIIPHLGQINITPYPGATGKLSLNMENRITRQLVCAKFINGIPVLQEPIEENGLTDNYIQ